MQGIARHRHRARQEPPALGVGESNPRGNAGQDQQERPGKTLAQQKRRVKPMGTQRRDEGPFAEQAAVPSLLIIVHHRIHMRRVLQHLPALWPSQRRDERIRPLEPQRSQHRRGEERLPKPVGQDDEYTVHDSHPMLQTQTSSCKLQATSCKIQD